MYIMIKAILSTKRLLLTPAKVALGVPHNLLVDPAGGHNWVVHGGEVGRLEDPSEEGNLQLEVGKMNSLQMAPACDNGVLGHPAVRRGSSLRRRITM